MCNMEPPLLSFHTLKLTQCVNLALPCLRGQQVDKELGWGNVSLWASEWSVDGKWCLFLPATTNVNEMQTCKKKKKKPFKTVIQPINRKWLGLGPQIFLPVPRADNEKKNTKHLSFRAIFNWVSKSNLELLWFSFNRSMISPKDSRNSRNQSDAKLKPITAWSPALSRALGGSVGFYCEFYCLFKCIVEKRILNWT